MIEKEQILTECDGAQDYDISLRLDAAGAQFKNVPVFLYAWRAHKESTAKKLSAKDYATPAGVRALTDYARVKQLDWECSPGYLPTTYRAKPRLVGEPQVQAVMLYRDEGEMTLRGAEKLLRQEGVKVYLTAVDNNSSDREIAEKLRKMGADVLRIDEPFNYSRLNNRAIKESTAFSGLLTDDDGLLLINNDVELEKDALREMCSWLYQPKVGIVGCRLHYANGLMQHGGIDLHQLSPSHKMVWAHTDAGAPFERCGFSRVIRATAGVTAACALLRRKTFLELGGFDEIFYPVAYSDTDLCTRIRRRGLYCLYTPYASGLHLEGASRGKGSIEDFETSRWLYQAVAAREKTSR